MKYKSLLNILFLIAISACSSSKTTVKKEQKLKEEAQAFSLSLVESYFSKDCEKFYNSISDSVLIMDGDGILAKADKKDRLCQAVGRAIKKREKTFQDYLEYYQVEMLTPAMLVERFGRELPDYYKTTETDFFFIGFELKEGRERSDNFIWDDMFVFMVRKVNGVWLMKGVSG